MWGQGRTSHRRRSGWVPRCARPRTRRTWRPPQARGWPEGPPGRQALPRRARLQQGREGQGRHRTAAAEHCVIQHWLLETPVGSHQVKVMVQPCCGPDVAVSSMAMHWLRRPWPCHSPMPQSGSGDASLLLPPPVSPVPGVAPPRLWRDLVWRGELVMAATAASCCCRLSCSLFSLLRLRLSSLECCKGGRRGEAGGGVKTQAQPICAASLLQATLASSTSWHTAALHITASRPSPVCTP